MAGSKAVVAYVPKKKLYVRKSKPSLTKYKKRYTNTITGMPSANTNGSIFKQKINQKMVYTESGILSSTTDIYGTEVIYSCNDLFDPKYSIGGHQPYYRDTFLSLYRKYKVLSCDVEITFTDPLIDATLCAVQVQPPGATATVGGQYADVVRERPFTIVKTLNDSGSQTAKVKVHIPIGKISGLTDIQFKADAQNYSANYGSSPAAIPKIRVACINARNVATSVCYNMKLTYNCQLFDLITQSQS